jgi:hypothetical protein
VRRAGHNVLLDAPGESAEQILRWTIESEESSTNQRVTSSMPIEG